MLSVGSVVAFQRTLWCALLGLWLCLGWACTGFDAQQTVTVGTFNIAWLGDGMGDRMARTEADIQRIAEVIRDANADVLALQEIENEEALKRVVRLLPEYRFVMPTASATNASKQRLAVLFKHFVALTPLGEYTPLAIDAVRHRAGFVVRCSVVSSSWFSRDSLQWVMMVVHFKSTSQADSTDALKDSSRSVRRLQAERTAQWLDSVQRHEPNVVVLGDMNDAPSRTISRTSKRGSTLDALMAHTTTGSATFLTEGMKSCKHALWQSIDHMLVSAAMNALYVPQSMTMVAFPQQYSHEQAARVSDHCPVVCRFYVRK
jgi:endonuclease/exonuclease/phosphatase family metal-dependent hydrolase